MQTYGADAAFPIADLEDQLPGLLSGARRLYHQLGRDAALDARTTAILDGMRARSRQGATPASAITDPREILHEMRLFKSEEELALMRHAAAITCEAHGAAVGPRTPLGPPAATPVLSSVYKTL